MAFSRVLLRWVVDSHAGFNTPPDFLVGLSKSDDTPLLFENDGTRTELYCLSLDWLAAQRERACMAAPGLKAIAEGRNPRLRDAARKALQAIGSH